MTVLEFALKAFSYIAVFWAGYFVACAMMASKRADEDDARDFEDLRDTHRLAEDPRRAA